MACNARECIRRGSYSWLAQGSTTLDCPVVCGAGFVLPNCVSPLENLIDAIGGILVFAGVVAALGLLVVCTFACVCTRVEWCPG